jgi:hypothetical protein
MQQKILCRTALLVTFTIMVTMMTMMEVMTKAREPPQREEVLAKSKKMRNGNNTVTLKLLKFKITSTV